MKTASDVKKEDTQLDTSASKGLQITFLVHAILSLVMGLALMLVPGRSLSLLGWVPDWVQLPNSELSIPGQTFVDPLITRLLGAALLALAYLSFRCWSGVRRMSGEVHLVVEFETVLCALSMIAILIAMLTMERGAGAIVWVILLVYTVFFAAWGVFWLSQRKAAG
jgi:uncharacterized membrane protein HdeD (DUF308 family)